jgi:hypothetical protein
MKKDDTLAESKPVRLWKKDDVEIAKIAKLFQMSEQEVIRRVVQAGITALNKDGLKRIVPLEFTVLDTDSREPSSALPFPPHEPQGSIMEEKAKRTRR